MTAALVERADTQGSAHGAGRSILLHLGPGVVAMAVYVVTLPVARHLGLPAIAALAVSGLVGVAPIQLAILTRHGHRYPGEPANLLRTRLPRAQLFCWVMVVISLSAGAFALTASWGSSLRAGAFGWWPAGWLVDTGAYPGPNTTALVVTACLMLLGSVIVAPVVEEFYFRGYLLPRMPVRLGRTAPLVHTVFFAGYHLWTPWLLPTRVLAVLPLAYVAARTRDIRVGIVVHVVLNATDLVLLIRYLF